MRRFFTHHHTLLWIPEAWTVWRYDGQLYGARQRVIFRMKS